MLAAPAAQLRVLGAISEVPREDWDALVGGPDALPFVRWDWFHAMEASKSASRKSGWEPHHLTLWRGERLVGAAPAYRKFHSMGEYVYDFGWASAAERAGINYYPKLLMGAPLSPITAPRFFAARGEPVEAVRAALAEAALASAEETECSSVHVIFPLPDEVEALTEAGWLRRLGMQYQWFNPGYRTFEDYLGRFSSKRRNQLRREKEAAGKQGIVIRTVMGDALEEKHATLAYRFYEATNSKNGWGRLQLNRDFFQRLFASPLGAQVELVLAERGGEVIAGAFNLGTKDVLYGRYWGCFEEHPFLHFNVCLYHSVEDCIARGRKRFEPGAGGEHKISRGFVPTAIHSAHRVFDPRLERAIGDFVKREREQVEEVLSRSEEIAGMKPWTGAP